MSGARVRVKARQDATQPISPVTWSKKMALACYTLNDEIGRGKTRVEAGGRHEADGLSA